MNQYYSLAHLMELNPKVDFINEQLQIKATETNKKKLVRAAGLLVFKPTIPLQVLLIAYRHPMYKHLFIVELPKGTIEAGEKPIETAQREVEEETGLPVEDITILTKFAPLKFYYKDAYGRDKEVYIYTAICKKCKVQKRTIEADYVFWAPIDVAAYLLTKEPMKQYLLKIAPRIYKEVLKVDKETLVKKLAQMS